MKRKTETQLEFPLLTLMIDPLSEHFVLVEMSMDWGLTGDVRIKYTSDQSLVDANTLLQFAANAVADETLGAQKRIARETRKKNPPPF